MRDAIAPKLHLFVCANRRENSPLGPGCGDHGEEVYEALKREVGARGLVAKAWVTKTHCLGICPKRGCTVARYSPSSPSLADPVAIKGTAIVTEVSLADVPSLLDPLMAAASSSSAEKPADDLDAFVHELDLLEELQKKKVLDLARRLKPGLTLEDVQNPHDFPELSDPDWHYADGVLTGIASVRSALLAQRKKKAT